MFLDLEPRVEQLQLEYMLTVVTPVIVCGSGTWAVAEMDMNRLSTWEREILIRIYGLAVEQGIWRVGINQELREM